MDLDLKPVKTVPLDPSQVVIRLRTTTWATRSGLYTQRGIVFLRRHCRGHNTLEEDISDTSAGDVLPKILNLDECEDGIYQVVVCNEYRDWESGYVEDWDYKLVPYEIKT